MKYVEAYAKARDIALRDFIDPTFDNVLALADRIYDSNNINRA